MPGTKLNSHLVGLLAVLFARADYGQQSWLIKPGAQLSSTQITVDEPAQAFGRYLASIQQRDPFTDSGLIGVEVEASLPKLAESGSMEAVRQTGAPEGNQYRVVKLVGNSTVKQQVIARYLEAEEQAAKLPYSSVAITPANYRFGYAGSVETKPDYGLYLSDLAQEEARWPASGPDLDRFRDRGSRPPDRPACQAALCIYDSSEEFMGKHGLRQLGK